MPAMTVMTHAHVDCQQTLESAGLAPHWWSVSPDRIDEPPRRKGYQSALTELLDPAGTRVGYLRVSWMDEQLLAERLTDPLAYYQEFQGWGLAPANDLAKRWEQTQRYRGNWQPDTSLPAERMTADLDALAREGAQELARHLAWAGTPFVAYVHLEDQYRGRGLGQALYEWTARRMGEQGMVLRASGCQSEQAVATWRRMQNRPELPVTTVKVPSLRKGQAATTHLCLDFRELVQS